MNLARTVECPEAQPQNSAGLIGDLHRCMQFTGQFPRSAQSIFAYLNIPVQSTFACVNILVQRNKRNSNLYSSDFIEINSAKQYIHGSIRKLWGSFADRYSLVDINAISQ